MPPQSSRHVDKTVVASPKVVAAVARTDTTSGKLHFKKVYRSGGWSQNTPPSLGGIRRGRGHITHIVQICKDSGMGGKLVTDSHFIVYLDGHISYGNFRR